MPHKRSKHISHPRRSKFITLPISLSFPLTIEKKDIYHIVNRAIKDGIGDWGLIEDSPRALPRQIIDIATNQVYTLTRAKLLRSIKNTLLDFPYALDTTAGYTLNIHKMTQEDIDEIIQVAIFREIRYGFI